MATDKPADQTPINAEIEFLDRAARLLDRFEHQIQIMSNPVNGTCPVFHEDEVFEIALPWASFEGYQFQIASRHALTEPELFNQLFDLIPTLSGKKLLDVGSFTGGQALVMRRFLDPTHVYMVEALNMLQAPLTRTIAANPEGCPVTLAQLVIDDGTMAMVKSNTRPARLSDTAYLRRETGKMQSHTIDGMDLTDIGLINLDIPGTKIYALRGAERLLDQQHPAVLVNLAGRDVDEMKEFMSPMGYEFVRMGRNSALFLPK